MTTIKFTQPITVDHIARIEGKAGIEVQIKDKKEVEVKVNIFEGPRLFESIVIGKSIEDATAVFPRVCSFCAAAHKITGLLAAENAIGLQVSEQTTKIRELMYIGDMIESHALHLFLLALPDFLGYPDGISMGKDHPSIIKTALQLKDLGAIIQTITGSRYIHQENALMGGFGKIPTKTKLNEVVKLLHNSKDISTVALEQFVKYELWEEVSSERLHLALEPKNNVYGIIGEKIKATDETSFNANEYRENIEERVVPHSFAKHSSYRGKRFTTGALSRITLFSSFLNDKGKELYQNNNNFINPNNPLSNNIAQAIELSYFIDRAEEITLEILDNYKEESRIKPTFKEGTGYAVTEAPRGLLAYMISVNKEGKVRKADIITPTAMFLAQKEVDLKIMTESLVKKGIDNPSEISQKLETIVRSYDPCVSCSVHVTKLGR